MAKKIPDNLDDPIDNIMYKLCEQLSPYFKNTNHTPNMITTYSLVFGLLACYSLYESNIPVFILFYILLF